MDLISTIKELISSKKNHKSSFVIQSIPIPIFWINRDFIYEGCSQIYADILGVNTSNDVLGKQDCHFNIPEKIQIARKSLFTQILSGKSSGGVLYDCVENKNGHHTWIQTRCTPITRGDNTIAVLGIIKDITESAQTQRKLTKSALQDAQVYQLLKETNETCMLTNNHHKIAESAIESLKLLFEANDVIWTSKVFTPSSHLEVIFSTSDLPNNILSKSLEQKEPSGFLHEDLFPLFDHCTRANIRSVFYHQLISTNAPVYHDIVFLINPNKTDVKNLKTIWEVVRRIADRLYISKSFTLSTGTLD